MKKRMIFYILSVFMLLSFSATVSAAEITDTCDDFSKVFEKSDFWNIKTNNSDKLGGDAGRFQRSSSATAQNAPDMQYITYQAENISNAEILYYYTSDTALSAFSVSYSPDNVNFTTVNCTKKVYQNTSGSWKGMQFDTRMLPYGTNYIRLEIAKAAPATGCGIGAVTIKTLEPVTEPYCDSLSFPFADIEKPWRIECGTSVESHYDATVIKTGDSDVIYATSSGESSRVVFGVVPEMEFLVTAYLSQSALPEDVFRIEFSEDMLTWAEAELYVIPYIIAENFSAEPYYAAVLKTTVPANCRFAKITALDAQWYYMLGEVELRNAVRKDLFVDELNDFKTVADGSLYTKIEIGHAMKTPYCSGDKTFSQAAPIVDKYGIYSNQQYLVWEVSKAEERGFLVEAIHQSVDGATSNPMRMFASGALEGPWEELEVGTEITDASVSNSVKANHYAEKLPADSRYIKVQWADAGNIFDYIELVELYREELPEIDRLRYFSDGSLLKKTPEFYPGTTAVTGRIKNPYRNKVLHLQTVAALYDGTGKLVSVNAEKMLGGVPAQGEKIFSVSVRDRYGTAQKLKLFFWDGMEPIDTEIIDVCYNPDEFSASSGEMIDEFEDFSKLYDHPWGFRTEENKDTARFYDFKEKFMREYPIEQSFKYCVPEAKSMVIDGFVLTRLGDLRIYASCYDGGYQLIPHQKSNMTYTDGGWHYLTYTVPEFPENTQFIKIVIEGNNGAKEYSPCITRVRISY